jgi:hypothetical protein
VRSDLLGVLEQQHHEAEFAWTDFDIATAGVKQTQRNEISSSGLRGTG